MAEATSVVSMHPGKDKHEFVKAIGLFDGTMIVVGSMIGSGIFIVAADIARQTGSAGGLLLTWILTGCLTIAAALSYGELAGMFPHAGGQYVYLREALGPLWGFLYGWTLFLVIQTGTIAAVAVAFGKFLGIFIPWVSAGNILVNLGTAGVAGHAVAFTLSTQQLVAILALIFCRRVRNIDVLQPQRAGCLLAQQYPQRVLVIVFAQNEPNIVAVQR